MCIRDSSFTASDIELSEFDAADYLTSEEIILEYIKCVMEENDDELLQMAHKTAARARAMNKKKPPTV